MRVLFSALAGLLFASGVHAATFQVTLSGTVSGGSTTAFDNADFTAFFKFDDTTTGTPFVPLFGDPSLDYAVIDAGFEIDGTSFASDNSVSKIGVSEDGVNDALSFLFRDTTGNYTASISLFSGGMDVLTDEDLSNVTNLETTFGDFTASGTFNEAIDAGFCSGCLLNLSVTNVDVMEMTAVPLPAGAGLLLSGLGVLGVAAARRRRRA